MTPLPGGVWVLATTAARPPDAELRRWAVLPGGGILALRTRRDGDRFAPPGLNGHTTKLNRWLAGRKVPSYLRDQIPLLTIQNEIAAVALAEGWVISADFTLRESAKETVYIGFLTEH
jgi:tRNA(Ile)-lysidine synthetase-like protein